MYWIHARLPCLGDADRVRFANRSIPTFICGRADNAYTPPVVRKEDGASPPCGLLVLFVTEKYDKGKVSSSFLQVVGKLSNAHTRKFKKSASETKPIFFSSYFSYESGMPYTSSYLLLQSSKLRVRIFSALTRTESAGSG